MEQITLENLFLVFFGAITIDFITGVLVSAKNGRLKSRTCSNGMFRSIGECIVLGIFIGISTIMPNFNMIFSTFICGFIFKEGLSIIENLIGLDVWIPDSLKKMLEVGINKLENMEGK
ncbi:phage holin family protein [Romboutsia sp.]|uniref:phage holin family protein n=1 Tax=Romboutsia sp. TaxID=1965302 RepID=UPI002CD5A91F|nr:phage holin family protein [Romboutsia sp.]HSQ88695.1 phage holin family protein [Romboutsia sp.]